jgi:hypothetical protein
VGGGVEGGGVGQGGVGGYGAELAHSRVEDEVGVVYSYILQMISGFSYPFSS